MEFASLPPVNMKVVRRELRPSAISVMLVRATSISEIFVLNVHQAVKHAQPQTIALFARMVFTVLIRL